MMYFSDMAHWLKMVVGVWLLSVFIGLGISGAYVVWYYNQAARVSSQKNRWQEEDDEDQDSLSSWMEEMGQWVEGLDKMGGEFVRRSSYRVYMRYF